MQGKTFKFRSILGIFIVTLYTHYGFSMRQYSNCWHNKQLCISVFEDRRRQIEAFHCHRSLLNIESFDETQFNKINDFKVR